MTWLSRAFSIFSFVMLSPVAGPDLKAAPVAFQFPYALSVKGAIAEVLPARRGGGLRVLGPDGAHGNSQTQKNGENFHCPLRVVRQRTFFNRALIEVFADSVRLISKRRMRAVFFSTCVTVALFLPRLCALAQDGAIPPDISFNSTAGRGDLIWIKLTSDTSEECNFGLDTGGTLTVLDKSWESRSCRRIAVQERLSGARWPILGVFTAPPLYLGSVRLLTGEKIATQDLAAHFPGHSVAGILGMDCLGHYCVQLDFSENKLRFLDPSRLGGLELGKEFPMTVLRGCFFVNDNVAGISGVRSLIDTGCNFDGVLSPPLFRQWTESIRRCVGWCC